MSYWTLSSPKQWMITTQTTSISQQQHLQRKYASTTLQSLSLTKMKHNLMQCTKNTCTKTRPTTQTQNDCPNLHPSDLPASCEQSNKCITEQPAHWYLGFHTLYDFKILNETGNGVIPLEWKHYKPMSQPSLQYSCTQTIPILISWTHGHWLWWLHCHLGGGVKIHNHVSGLCNKIQMDLWTEITYPQSHYCHTWIVPCWCWYDPRNILHWLWSITNQRKNSRLDKTSKFKSHLSTKRMSRQKWAHGTQLECCSWHGPCIPHWFTNAMQLLVSCNPTC